MKVMLTLALCLALLVLTVAGANSLNGRYFSFEKIADHFANDFPSLPDLNEGDFLTHAGKLFNWCGDVVNWVTTFDPWEEGTPSYREPIEKGGAIN